MIILSNIIPFKGYDAMNLFGIIIFRKDFVLKNPKNSFCYMVTLNHEKIHTAQIKELFYIGFYILYLYYYLKGLMKYKCHNTAYLRIPFEVEAYCNEHNEQYLDNRERHSYKMYNIWKQY